MKLLVSVLLVAACASADVSHLVKNHAAGAAGDVAATVVRSDSAVEPESFHYAYETSNGISGESAGQLKRVDNNDAIVSQGAFRHTAPDGTVVETSYVADENGYQPKGAHLPTPPPIPEAILRALEYIRTHPPQPETYVRQTRSPGLGVIRGVIES